MRFELEVHTFPALHPDALFLSNVLGHVTNRLRLTIASFPDAANLLKIAAQEIYSAHASLEGDI